MKKERKIKISKLLFFIFLMSVFSLIAGFISVYFTNPDLKEVVNNNVIEIIKPKETDTDEDDSNEELPPEIVYPEEEEKVYIALNLDNGTEIVMYELDSGSIFNEPVTPTKSGWIFDEWSSTVAYTFGNPVTQNMTITALYTKIYDITLNYNEEFWEDETRPERIEEYSIIRNDVLLLPTLPTTEEYFVFDGWLEENSSNIFINQVQIQRDMVLIAQFRDIRPAVVEPILNYNSETKTISILNASAFTNVLLTVSSPDESVCFSGNSDSYTFSNSLGSGNYIANATATDEWGRETTNSINIDYTQTIDSSEITINGTTTQVIAEELNAPSSSAVSQSVVSGYMSGEPGMALIFVSDINLNNVNVTIKMTNTTTNNSISLYFNLSYSQLSGLGVEAIVYADSTSQQYWDTNYNINYEIQAVLTIDGQNYTSNVIEQLGAPCMPLYFIVNQ